MRLGIKVSLIFLPSVDIIHLSSYNSSSDRIFPYIKTSEGNDIHMDATKSTTMINFYPKPRFICLKERHDPHSHTWMRAMPFL